MLLVGAGGLAAQLFDDLDAMKINDIAFWSERGTKFPFITEKYPLLKTDADVQDYFKRVSPAFALCIGDTNARKMLTLRFEQLGGELTSFINPFSNISAYCSIGKGCMILRDVDVEAGVIIGDGCLINKQANLGHGCIIAANCEIGPTSLISPEAEIGENTLVGIGSIILHKIKIGQNVTVSAGSVVTKNIKDNAVVSGSPAILRFYKKLK